MTTLTVDSRVKAAEDVIRSNGEICQMSLAGSVKLSGTGLHSGECVDVIIHPAPADTGVVFVNDGLRIPALVSNVVDTSRGTTVGINGTRVRTIEHLLAALRGTGVDNALIEVSGSEMPALDGSALPYCEAIEAVGLVELDAWREPITIPGPICVQQNGSFVLAVPASEFRVTFVLNYDHPLIGSQTATYELDEKRFARDIAPARTFVLYEEVAELLDNDLARGGNLGNVIVVWQDRMSSELRLKDELVKHKITDFIGDVSLIGGLPHADILAVKSGHWLNVEFAREIMRVTARNPI